MNNPLLRSLMEQHRQESQRVFQLRSTRETLRQHLTRMCERARRNELSRVQLQQLDTMRRHYRRADDDLGLASLNVERIRAEMRKAAT